MLWTKVRTARKSVLCECCESRRIEPGEQYLESVISPWHEEVGNQTWWRMKECRECLDRYNRWPKEQVSA